MDRQPPAQTTKASPFLHGFVILFTGVEEVVRSKATEFVLRSGGKCVDKFCKQVTCGIVGRVGAPGYKELLESKVTILSFKWLQDCSALKSLAPMDGSKYKVGYSTGVQVVCTQLDAEERTRVKELTERGGGMYSDRFVGKDCTHLIAKTPEGDKYMSAKKCGTRIVTIDWIEECAKKKVWVPELEFSVDYLARRAQREARAAKAQRLHANPLPQASSSTQAGDLATGLPLVAQLESFLHSEITVPALPSHTMVSADRQDTFRDELFWIHGYSAEMTDYLTRSILMGGGLRSMVLCDAVTVVLLGGAATNSDWLLVRRHPCGVPVVNVVWVIEQLHGVPALLKLFGAGAEETTGSALVSPITLQSPLGSFLQSIDTTSVSCMDDLCRLYEASQAERRQLHKQPSLEAATDTAATASQGVSNCDAATNSADVPSRPTKRTKRGEDVT